MFLKIGVPKKKAKSLKNTPEQVYFLAELRAAGLQHPKIWNLLRCFSKMLWQFEIHEYLYILRNKSWWLLLFVLTNSKKLFRSKGKIIYANDSLQKRTEERTIAGNVFIQPGTEITRNYPFCKHLWNTITF